MASNYNDTTPSTSFNRANECLQKKKFKFVSLSITKVKEVAAAICQNSAPVLTAAASALTPLPLLATGFPPTARVAIPLCHEGTTAGRITTELLPI